MRLCRTTFARVFLLLAMCVWVAGTFVASVHHVGGQHVVCAEHGEVFELDTEGNPVYLAESGGPELRAATPDASHDHGCSFDVFFLDGITIAPPAMGSLPFIYGPNSAPPALAEAPCAPPLTYAPKTSPPQTC
jgi:hypothetical protein